MTHVDLNFDNRKALLFALTSERLSVYYEHDVWPDDNRALDTAKVWLMRQDLVGPPRLIRELAQLSGQFAKTLADSLSREAGLYMAHEMNQSLDPNHASPVAMDLLDECGRLLREASLAD
ncbi:hypothetical protein WM40_17140 [Robbsia andropogonis]|uniref:Uncharacterized protein n=1 Tax=Robbsia andropogonis TaxID=28092 RepID=A0A0F5JXE6_9BURK|nr:hypothetical protein [Robbsia andropogonis]KKB62516.1 hypothetical protein WM40_17140 [Robbsia andropogonis]MCP1116971.1 hypothetical protein [Robbsia andropogonis]MCP1126350.1 hypothetical protein [Robbsia andropogonis]